MRKKCVRWAKPVLACVIATATMFVARTAVTSAQSIDPASLPRLAFSNLSYVGGFRLPAESANGDSFSIGGRALTFSAQTHSLFVSSRAGRVAEVSIPSPVNSADPNALPFATYLQGFFDPTEGHLSQVSTEGVNLDSLLVYGGRLFGTASIYYDAQNTQRVSHFSRSLQLNQPSFSGWSGVWDSLKTGYVSGTMASIPKEWQSILGGPATTGQCCIPIVGRTSWGPSAFAFDPAMVGQSTVPATPLLYYTADHATLGPWDGSNPTYGATIQMGGMAIIAGTRTALFFGRNGTGPNCYGNGTADQSLDGVIGPDGAHWCYDPTSSDKGSHAYPYRYQIWAYDLADFAAVKAGTKQPWDVVPYGVWPFDFPTQDSQVKIGGVGYDAATQTLYVSQMLADRDGYSYRPVVHVLHVNGANGVSYSDEPQLPDPTPTTSVTSPAPAPAPSPAPDTTTSSVIKSITLAVNRTAPQAPGTAITFTAFATGGVVPQEFKWLIDDGAGFKPVTAWSTIDSFTWTPAIANANYRVGVWARSNGNSRDEAEASASAPFVIAAPVYVPVQSVTFTPDKAAPQTAGSSITFKAVPQGGQGPIQFKWLIHDGGSWSAVTGWSSADTFTWTPAIANSNYRVGVWTKSDGNSKDEPDATASDDYPIGALPPVPVSAVSFSADKPAPQAAGTTITFTATPQGGNGSVEYKWLVHDGGSWSAVTGWSTQNTFTWTPSIANSNYRIGIWARSKGTTTDQPDATASDDYPISAATTAITVTAPSTTVTTRLTDVILSTDAPAPQPLGRTITAVATPVGGANYTYRWLIHDGVQWNVVTDWTTSNLFAWTPAKADPNWRIGVWVRNGDNTSENYDVSTSLLFPIQ